MSENDLPWPTVPLRDLVEDMCLGKMLDKNKNRGTLQPYLRNTNVRWGSFELSDLKEMRFEEREVSRFSLKDGDLVVCEGGEPGRAAVWKGQLENAKIQKALHRIRFSPQVYVPEFAMYFLTWGTASNRFQSFYTGTTIKHLTGASLSRIEFPVVSMAQQRCIVEKIEELFSELDAGVAALERAKANLKRYRASVLKAAVDGSLTADWRAKHPEVEPASHLLERILAERRRKWEEEQLAKFEAAGKKPPKDWEKKYQEPVSVKSANLPELPSGWCWASFDQIADSCLGKMLDKSKHVTGTKMPYLRNVNVRWHGFELDDLLQMYFEDDQSDRFGLLPGDVLVCEGGEPGRAAVWEDQVANMRFQKALHRLRCASGVQPCLIPLYLEFMAKTKRLDRYFTGSTIKHLTGQSLSKLPFPLAPSEEQAVIVAAVREQVGESDLAGRSIESAMQRATRLRQSILKQAFEGKLVPQDPADEPAEIMLAKIQAQKPEKKSKAAPKPMKRANLPKQIFQHRASVVSYTVERLAARQSFGRIQLLKTMHLAQCHLGIEMGFTFERYEAGPFDPAIYPLEKVAAKEGWFSTKERKRYGVTYHPGEKINEIRQHAIEFLGEKKAELDQLLDHIAQMNTDEAELFATAYAAWDDLLLDGRPADDDAIIEEIYAWHEKKRKFKCPEIKDRLKWMRHNAFVPAPQGLPTRALAGSPRSSSRRRKSQ